MDVLFFREFNQPQSQFLWNDVQSVRRLHLPSLIDYVFLGDPEYDVGIVADVANVAADMEGLAPSPATGDALRLYCCRRSTNEVVFRSLPLWTTTAPAAAAAATTTPKNPKCVRAPDAMRADRGIRAGPWRIFFSRSEQTLCVEAPTVTTTLRDALIALGMFTTDKAMLDVCVPFTFEDDMCAHFALAMRRATILRGLASSSSTLSSSTKILATANSVAGGGGNALQASLWLAAMSREWYWRYHPTGAAVASAEQRPTTTTTTTPMRMILGQGTIFARKFQRLWLHELLPEIDSALRRASIGNPSGVEDRSAVPLLVAVEDCWRSLCMSIIERAGLREEWSALMSQMSTPVVYHLLFESVSQGIAHEDHAALRRFLHNGGAGGAWTVHDIETDPLFFLSDHARAVQQHHDAPSTADWLEVWIDHRPFGYMQGTAVHEWPRAFRLFRRERLGASSCASYRIDWIRRTLHIHTQAGRLGQWFLTPTTVDDQAPPTPPSTFAEAVAQGRVEWIDYQSEMHHVEIGCTHFPLHPEWATKTWYDLSFDAATAVPCVSKTAPLLHAVVVDDRVPPVASSAAADMLRTRKDAAPTHQGNMRAASMLAPHVPLQSLDLARISEEITVAVGCFGHPEVEGAGSSVLVNQAAIDRGVLARTLFFPVRRASRSTPVVRLHQQVRRGQVLALDGGGGGSGSVLILSPEDGFVHDIQCDCIVVSKLYPFLVSSSSSSSTLTSCFVDRAGRSWPVGRVLPEHLMPFHADTGDRPDVILSPLALTRMSEWSELLAPGKEELTPLGGGVWLSPRSGGRVIEGSDRWTLSSMFVSRGSSLENNEDDQVPWKNHEQVAVSVNSKTGECSGGDVVVSLPRTWVDDVLLRRVLPLGGHAYFFTDDMVPFRWDLAGWSSASQTLFAEEQPDVNRRAEILLDAKDRFRDTKTKTKSKSKSKTKNDKTEAETETETEDAEQGKSWFEIHQQEIRERAQRQFEQQEASFASRYPNISFNFDGYWQKFAAPSDGVLHLQEQTRAFVEDLQREIGVRSAWRANVHQNQFQHVMSGRIVPFIDTRTLFILRSKKKFSDVGLSASVGVSEAARAFEVGGGGGGGGGLLALRAEKLAGVFAVGDIVLFLADTVRQRKWRVKSKEAERVFIIELLPSESTMGLTQLSKVVLADQLWHFEGEYAAAPLAAAAAAPPIAVPFVAVPAAVPVPQPAAQPVVDVSQLPCLL